MILDMESSLKKLNLIYPTQDCGAGDTWPALDVSGYVGWAQVDIIIMGITAVTGTCRVVLQQATTVANSATGLTAGSTAPFATTKVSMWTAVGPHQSGSPTYESQTATETAANATAIVYDRKYIDIDKSMKYIRARSVIGGASPNYCIAAILTLNPITKPV